MLYLAGRDNPGPSRGTVIRIEGSPFAPDDRLLEDDGSRATDGEGFARRIVWQWRVRWKADPSVFLDLITLASGGTDVTLCDGWGDGPARAPEGPGPRPPARRQGGRGAAPAGAPPGAGQTGGGVRHCVVARPGSDRGAARIR